MFGFDFRRSVFEMYAADAVSRTEYRRLQRAKTLQKQKIRRKFILFFALTLAVMFAIGVGFGTMLARAEEPKTDSSYKYYANIEIERGDTLWTLADEYMDSIHYSSRMDYIDEVMSINHLVSDQLISGQKLIVPYYSTVLK